MVVERVMDVFSPSIKCQIMTFIVPRMNGRVFILFSVTTATRKGGGEVKSFKFGRTEGLVKCRDGYVLFLKLTSQLCYFSNTVFFPFFIVSFPLHWGISIFNPTWVKIEIVYVRVYIHTHT